MDSLGTRRILVIAALLSLLAPILTFPPARAQGTVVAVEPQATTNITPGDSFEFNITVRDVVDLRGFQLKVTYDTAVLSASQATFGAFFAGQLEAGCGFGSVTNNTAAGTISVFLTLFGDPCPSFTGTTQLIVGNFTVDSVGQTDITIQPEPDTILSDSLANPIPHTIQNGSFSNTSLPTADLVVTFTDANGNAELDPGEIVLFDASGSIDPSPFGQIVRYEFDFDGNQTIDYTETPSGAPDGSFDGKTTSSYAKLGIFDAKVIVTNNGGLSNSATRQVTVPLHDLMITAVQVTPGEIWANGVVEVTVIFKNNGNVQESFDVKASVNATAIGSSRITGLAVGASQFVVFTWNTTGTVAGRYSVKVELMLGPGLEDETPNNNIKTVPPLTLKVQSQSQGPSTTNYALYIAVAGISAAAVAGSIFFIRSRQARKEAA